MSQDDLREILHGVTTLGRRLQDDGPQTDDELDAWIQVNIGVKIPRTCVCPDHQSPFQFLADLYFERIGSALALANRGGSKTFVVAILHFLNCTFKPGCEALSFGATEAQGNRCYGNIEDWCYVRDPETGRKTEQVKGFIDGKPMKSETNWKTGSSVEVVAGTPTAVSGPHPAKSHADEVDQMDRATWDQSRGMAVTNKATGPLPKFMKDKQLEAIPPQDIVTSTRNSRHGLMQELIDEILEDEKEGNIPQFNLFTWCIWETVSEVPNCRGADPVARAKRLAELGMDPTSLCECNRVVKGRDVDSEGNVTKRTLEVVCAGKAFKARGWKPYVDLVTTFKRNTKGTWTLQHECREGKDENTYIEDWDLTYYGIRGFKPNPGNGPIYQGIDWGGTNAHAVLWFQYLHLDVPALDYNFEPIFLSSHIYVLFKEIYVASIDTAKLADRVIGIEDGYREEFGARWKVEGRFMDPQGKADRLHFARRGMPGRWPFVSRQKDKMIVNVQNIVEDDRFAVVVDEAPMFCEEVEVWGQDPKTGKEIDEFNHAMSAWRYGISNAEVLEEANRPSWLKKQLKEKDAARAKRNSGRPKVVIRGAGLRQEGRGSIGPVGTSGGGKHPTDQFAMTR
jgi:hypothetical protein